MISDYYKDLIKRTVTRVPDSGGSYTEVVSDYSFKGFISMLSSFEVVSSMQLQLNATARLFTHEILETSDRVIDDNTIYEVVGCYNFFHRYYDIKKIQ